MLSVLRNDIQVGNVSHGWPSVGTVPRMVHLAHVGNQLLHLTCIKSSSNHYRLPTGSGGKHLPDPGRTAHNPRTVTQHKDQFIDVLGSKGPVFASWQGNQLSSFSDWSSFVDNKIKAILSEYFQVFY